MGAVAQGGDSGAKAVHFAMGVMTDSLFLAQRLLPMPTDWYTTSLKSIRWCLVEPGGTLITHGRQLILTLATRGEKDRLDCEMRRHTYALSSA